MSTCRITREDGQPTLDGPLVVKGAHPDIPVWISRQQIEPEYFDGNEVKQLDLDEPGDDSNGEVDLTGILDGLEPDRHVDAVLNAGPLAKSLHSQSAMPDGHKTRSPDDITRIRNHFNQKYRPGLMRTPQHYSQVLRLNKTIHRYYGVKEALFKSGAKVTTQTRSKSKYPSYFAAWWDLRDLGTDVNSEIFEDYIKQLLPHCGRRPELRFVLVIDNRISTSLGQCCLA
ncbi:uncharacterized protein BDR25DRAFT_359848 [Lindgomyces ingoldianus]|uniref:Uncharacterized protein n=1 Tax=Lindgomyces ingoldianus TaxID=673940 RepID=A0ACB6QIU2_9PLEO|nr:uncharacterized protein BDR25DRAFT_359848 [Lindgomyces ingoldianus]KAF2466055.1 hypothetical protein BDR25DRAFT_359848 [Lindgomyces ingoldianus]